MMFRFEILCLNINTTTMVKKNHFSNEHYIKKTYNINYEKYFS